MIDALVAIALVVTMALGAAPPRVSPGTAPDVPTIAQGVARVRPGPRVWAVTRQAATTAICDGCPGSPLGFVVADVGELQVTIPRRVENDQVLLDPGEALFVREDEYQDRMSASQPYGYYLTLELLPAGARPSRGMFPRRSDVLFESDPFVLGRGGHELELKRVVLGRADTLNVPASPLPVLAFVTAGSATIGDSGAQEPIGSGEAALVNGGSRVVAGQGGATLLLVLAEPLRWDGADAPQAKPVATSGAPSTLRVRVWHCDGAGQRRFGDFRCVEAPAVALGDVDLLLRGQTLTRPLRRYDLATSYPGGAVWLAIPPGAYRLAVRPAEWWAEAVVSPRGNWVSLEPTAVGSVYAVSIAPGAAKPGIDVWLVGRLGQSVPRPGEGALDPADAGGPQARR